MDIGKSFSYIFEDKDWLSKVLIGSLIFLISLILTPILIGFLGFAILGGYGLEVLSNVRRGHDEPLPEWRDKWGEWLVLGLKLAVVLFIWALPVLVLAIPFAIGAGLAGQQGSEAIGAILALCFGCLGILWGAVIIVAQPAIYIRLAETGSISAGLQIKDIIDFTRDNIGEVLIAIIVYLLVSTIVPLIATLVGTLLCGVGLILTVPAATVFTTLIQSHLYGQIGTGGGYMQAPAEYDESL